MGKNKSKTRRKIHKKLVKSITVDIDKLITLAELGLGASRPLNKEKRDWINKLAKQSEKLNPILVAPIKDTGYYVLCDGWHKAMDLET
jgi:ABC-type Zn2+ transport system substrate-binding protein/surface adhesin